MKVSFSLPYGNTYYNYLGCDDSQGFLSLIGIQDGSLKKNSALGDYYYMSNRDDLVFGALRGGPVGDGSDAGLFSFNVRNEVSFVYVYVGFRSNLISLRQGVAATFFLE